MDMPAKHRPCVSECGEIGHLKASNNTDQPNVHSYVRFEIRIRNMSMSISIKMLCDRRLSQ